MKKIILICLLLAGCSVEVSASSPPTEQNVEESKQVVITQFYNGVYKTWAVNRYSIGNGFVCFYQENQETCLSGNIVIDDKRRQ